LAKNDSFDFFSFGFGVSHHWLYALQLYLSNVVPSSFFNKGQIVALAMQDAIGRVDTLIE